MGRSPTRLREAGDGIDERVTSSNLTHSSIPNSAPAVRHRLHTAMSSWQWQSNMASIHSIQCPWFWQSDIRHTQQCPWFWQSDIGHTQQCPWLWQSDIGHTQQWPCGTDSQTSAIHSSALVVLAVRHRPYTAVPLWYWQSGIGHTQQ